MTFYSFAFSFYCDFLQAARNAWIWVFAAFFAVLAASLALTTRFGFGMELPMLAESGRASALLASLFVAAFASESLLSKSGLSCGALFSSRPHGMSVKTASSAAAAASWGFIAYMIVLHSTSCAGLFLAGDLAGPAVSLACILCFFSLPIVAPKAGLGSKLVVCAVLFALAPSALLPLLQSPLEKLGPDFSFGLISGASQSIVLAGVSVLAQALAPGAGGIALSLLAFLAGSMKSFFRFEDFPPVAEKALETVFAPIPDFQSAGLMTCVGGLVSMRIFDSLAYSSAFLVGASILSHMLSSARIDFRNER